MGGAGDDGWGKFVRTERNDLISRRAHLFGVRMLSLYGMVGRCRPARGKCAPALSAPVYAAQNGPLQTVLERDAVLRCDLGRISVGALAFLARGCMVKPPSIRDKEGSV